MRYFQISIDKYRTETRTKYTWPIWWDEVKALVEVLAYENDWYKLGHVTEGAVCRCAETTWATIAKKGDLKITELDATGANEKGRQWKPARETINNEAKVIEVVKAFRDGKTLTADQTAAINPDNAATGITTTPLFEVGILPAMETV